MPKDWQLHKVEIETLYITDGHTLEDVRKTLKANHGFDASTRAYRMKLDEWQIRKNKTNKSLRNHSPDSRDASEMETDDVTPSDGSSPSDHLFYNNGQRNISPSTASGLHLLGPSNSHQIMPHTPMNGLEMEDPHTSSFTDPSPPLATLFRIYQSGESLNTYVQSILELDGSGNSIFKYSQRTTTNLFDEISAHIPRHQDLALAKAFILSSFDVAPNLQNLSWNLRQWLSAYKQPDWRHFQDYLVASNLAQTLGKCMSQKGTRLALDAIFFLVGDRLCKEHKEYMDSYHSLKQSDCSVVAYEHHRNEFTEILKDFRDRRREMGMQPTWEEFLLDILEWQNVPRATGDGQLKEVPIPATDGERNVNGNEEKG